MMLSGGIGGLHPALAVLCLLGVVGGMLAVALMNNSAALFRKVDLNQPRDAPAFRASEIQRSTWYMFTRGDRIRTCDLSVPNAAL